ncbi:UbiA prenyltransferase family-domain-containing protein [Hygrophoropsis aurantiaca]|uniref:UbiA prenyltransferase family-domain-containing protein n=1 Tax=Hygrophoropsis aurantiaca TaxID=72124 RepID=A0ACB8A9S4_9AGAM|nr:UbiA prenyltransferase family-domain-containing protein [Hygrophoropsis aurantiaca]
MLLRSFGQTVEHCAQTLFLFTKADITTTVVPITLFATVAAPVCNIKHALHAIGWIWLHLLQFDVANQVVNPDEDKANKSTRPLPAGRITLRNAIYLRWALIPICLVASATYSIQTFGASMAVAGLTIWYNELEAHSHWSSKNVMTAVGFASFELGGTLVAGCDRSRLESTGALAIALSTCVFITTLHAQDFKDEEGDRLIGRKTLPIVFPSLSRASIMIGLPLWSICLSLVWGMDWLSTFVFVAFALLVGSRFATCTTVQGYRVSCKLYSLWFSLVHLLPGYWRYYHEAQSCIISQ